MVNEINQRDAELRRWRSQYEELKRLWAVFELHLLGGFDNWEISPAKKVREGRVEFPLFGKIAFAKFSHGLELGYIEYGVIAETVDGPSDMTMHVVGFDEKGKSQFGSVGMQPDVNLLHKTALCELCKRAFTEPVVE